jgi:divalent metal cation (Fe/Co/Zn/Cd) transporter
MNSNNQIDTTIMNKVMLLTKEKKYRKIRELVSVEPRLKDIKISANKNKIVISLNYKMPDRIMLLKLQNIEDKKYENLAEVRTIEA